MSMNSPMVSWLHSGKTLHLNHGPIDLLIRCEGHEQAVGTGYQRAQEAFADVLATLVQELSELRMPMSADSPVCTGPVAQRMQRACKPFAPHGLSPMAAVAGAVADYLLSAISVVPGVTRAWVNNGGDIALYLTPGHQFNCAVIGDLQSAAKTGNITLCHRDRIGGMATSGQAGRSFSLGIADAVTVLADCAASADAAATMIANAVDLPGHPAISRAPARTLDPDSDLHDRLVTLSVGELTPVEVSQALQRGKKLAAQFVQQGYIESALLLLRDKVCSAGSSPCLSVTLDTSDRQQNHLPSHLASSPAPGCMTVNATTTRIA